MAGKSAPRRLKRMGRYIRPDMPTGKIAGGMIGGGRAIGTTPWT